MKNVFLISILCSLFISCQPTAKNAENEIATTESMLVSPQNISANPGQITISDTSGTLLYFSLKDNVGKIILNQKEYILTKYTFEPSSNIYVFLGEEIGITIENCEATNEDSGEDCFKFSAHQLVIHQLEKELIIKEISIQDCPLY